MSVAAFPAKRDLESFMESPGSPVHLSPTCRSSAQSKRVRLSPVHTRIFPLAQAPNIEQHNQNLMPTDHAAHLCKGMGGTETYNDNMQTSPSSKRGRFTTNNDYNMPESSTYHLPSPPREAGGEILFTFEQLKSIVSHALEEKDASMRAQYDRMLQQKLTEQFNAFAKFNEDYIHRFNHDQMDMYYNC